MTRALRIVALLLVFSISANCDIASVNGIYTAVNRSTGGRWQLVSWQSTRMQ